MQKLTQQVHWPNDPGVLVRTKAMSGSFNALPVRIAGLALPLMLAVSNAIAAPVDDARAAYGRKDYVVALQLLQPLVKDHPQPEAEYLFGLLYFNGLGVPEDKEEGLKWLIRAAEQGYGDAEYLVGVELTIGLDVPKDAAKGVYWLRRSADRGYVDAQVRLGLIYSSGEEGVPVDFSESRRWLRMAESNGSSYARGRLAYMYFNGEGVERDYAEALTLYRKNAVLNDAYAQYRVGTMYEEGLGIGRDYQQALKWYLLSAEQGGAGAEGDYDNLLRLMSLYRDGRGVEADAIEAMKWCMIANQTEFALMIGPMDCAQNADQAKQFAEAEARAKKWMELHGSGTLEPGIE